VAGAAEPAGAPSRPDVRARPATADDLPGLAETTAAAFLDDPVFCWCYPDAARRRAILPTFFDLVIRGNLGHGGVLTTDGALGGAVWVPPGGEGVDEELSALLADVSSGDAPRLAGSAAWRSNITRPSPTITCSSSPPARTSSRVGSARP
jgi:hypothetical protein